MAKKQSHPESALQIQCVSWFNYTYPHLTPLFFAVPNGGSRNPREAAIMKAEGIRAGVSDLILNIPAGRNTQLAIEMKDEKGRQSPEQERYQRYADAAGIKYIICRSFEAFKAEVTEYIDRINPAVLDIMKLLAEKDRLDAIEDAKRRYRKLCSKTEIPVPANL